MFRQVLIALAAALLCLPAAAQKSYPLPCSPQTVAPSADGSLVWFTCRTGAKWEQYQRELAAAAKTGKYPPAYGTNAFQDALYALDRATGQSVKLAESMAPITVYPAPQRALAVVTFPQPQGIDQAFLYKAGMRGQQLPINASFLLWSADATHLYFYWEPNSEADAWNKLGILDLASGKKSMATLQRPGENVYVCSRDAHLFAGDPAPDPPGADADEYDAAGRFLRQARHLPAGYLSAKCTYIASQDSFHGPLDWFVIEASTGKRLMRVPFQGEAGEYEFQSWNPKRDSLLLRTQYASDDTMGVEAFDVAQQKAVLRSSERGPVSWSADGDSLLVGRGNRLIELPLPDHQ